MAPKSTALMTLPGNGAQEHRIDDAAGLARRFAHVEEHRLIGQLAGRL
jgi:hypothetical protein